MWKPILLIYTIKNPLFKEKGPSEAMSRSRCMAFQGARHFDSGSTVIVDVFLIHYFNSRSFHPCLTASLRKLSISKHQHGCKLGCGQEEICGELHLKSVTSDEHRIALFWKLWKCKYTNRVLKGSLKCE